MANNLDYIESNSKCNLTFTSSMSKAEYDEYIKSGVALRRNTYRGKDITDYYTGEQTINGKDLYKQISDGTFDDIYVGDYFTGKSGKIWLIADLDNYWHQGDSGDTFTKHHATIISDGNLEVFSMNHEDTTEGGYVVSDMVKTILGDKLEANDTTILGKYIFPDFGNHVLKYRNQLTNAMEPTRINQTGEIKVNQDNSISGTGASSNWAWYDRYLDLMSEVNVYGTTVWSSSGYDIGIDNRQYAIFQLRPELINQTMSGTRFAYWLKAVAHSKAFVDVNQSGRANLCNASNTDGVRPRFLID